MGVAVPVRVPARRSGVPTPPPSVRVRGRELGDASTDTKIREDMVAWGRLWGRLWGESSTGEEVGGLERLLFGLCRCRIYQTNAVHCPTVQPTSSAHHGQAACFRDAAVKG